MKIIDETEIPIPKDKKKSKKDKKEKKKTKKVKISDENGHDNGTEESETVDKTPELNGNGNIAEELENGHTEIELTPEQKAGALKNFKISPSTVEKLKARGVTYLFPIQAQTFNDIYNGEDVIGQARTGTGKTLSFALPLIEKLHEETKKKWGRMPKVLVMAPTRELAKQVSDDFLSIGENISVFCIYGGTPYAPQENAIRSGLDVLVGTPGRILDHIQKGNLDLSKLKHVVLDEVDQMLDMGFADSVDEIIKSAYEREDGSKPQTLLFSATLPPWVYQTAKKYMKEDVKKVNLVGSQETRTAKNVQHLAIKCGYFDRAATIGDVIQVYSGEHGRAIVFCQTKRDADELAINPVIKQDAHVLHGDIPQEKREKVLKGFKNGTYKVLISTDVAARGLDIPEVDLVIQCNPPKDVDSYIHRSGRTGRAGRSGVCICFYKPQEDYDLSWVEKKAQLKFKKIGGPTAEDIIKASASDAARSLADVSDETLLHFKDSAETLIAERGATNALAAALAVISGTTKIVKRSLLSSKEGYTTYLFQTNIEMRGTGYAWRALEKQLPYELKEKIMRMRFTKDKMGCVFDVPSESESEIEELWKDGKFDTLQKATALPELLESDNSQNGFSRGGSQNGFSRGGRGGRGGWGRDGGSQRGGGRGRGNGGRGFKRKSDTSIDFNSPAQNKKIKFD